MEVHKQYNLRSKKTYENPPKKVTETKKTIETKKTSEPSTKKVPEKGNAEPLAKRNPTILQISMQIEVSSTNLPSTSAQKTMVNKSELVSQSRAPTLFSLEGELAKVKIPIPLSELMSKNVYRLQVIKVLSIELDIGMKALTIGSTNHLDTVNLTDDQLELLFGPEVDGQIDTGAVAPFYIRLNIHDLILHNAMLE
jgi:hypothetical protein